MTTFLKDPFLVILPHFYGKKNLFVIVFMKGRPLTNNLETEKIFMDNKSIAPSWQIFSSSTLKMIAVITMFIDHFGYTVVYWSDGQGQYYQLCRDIGRIAFPIYCFLLVEGFFYTRSRLRYTVNLLIFGILSEIPFNLALGAAVRLPGYQNVFFTLSCGLLAIWGMEKIREKHILLMVLPAAAGMAAAYLLHTDYDFKGVLLIVILYLFREQPVPRFFCGALCLYWEWKAIFAWIPITLYNKKRGWMSGPVLKYLFYVFYPAHLLLLAYLRYHFFRI